MSGRQPPVSALITCEHASNRVPERWRGLFAGSEAILAGHRGWDPGAAELGALLATRLDAPLLEGEITRLLIDLNRPAGHPQRFSQFSRQLPASEQRELEIGYWQPHWERFGAYLDTLPGRIVHLACHSFTPVKEGRERAVDIGLLYDPGRPRERDWCRDFRARLQQQLPGCRIQMNQPYRGVSSSLGQHHRRYYGDGRFISVEIEINQGRIALAQWPIMRATIAEAVAATLASGLTGRGPAGQPEV